MMDPTEAPEKPTEARPEATIGRHLEGAKTSQRLAGEAPQAKSWLGSSHGKRAGRNKPRYCRVCGAPIPKGRKGSSFTCSMQCTEAWKNKLDGLSKTLITKELVSPLCKRCFKPITLKPAYSNRQNQLKYEDYCHDCAELLKKEAKKQVI